MDHKDDIQKAIDYIENNLTHELDLPGCARAAGYSMYYFLRIFKETVNLTPGKYIRKRRLSEIARRISEGDSFIADIAFMYGFNSKENFTRAFKQEHGVLPKEYRREMNPVKLYDKITLKITPSSIVTEIIFIDPIYLSVNEVNKNTTLYEYALRQKRNRNNHTIYKVVHDKSNDFDYIGHISGKNYEIPGSNEYIMLKGGNYLVFNIPATTNGYFTENINAAWNYIENLYFPNENYEKLESPAFEIYTTNSKSLTQKICVPVKLK